MVGIMPTPMNPAIFKSLLVSMRADQKQLRRRIRRIQNVIDNKASRSYPYRERSRLSRRVMRPATLKPWWEWHRVPLARNTILSLPPPSIDM
jgi:hypothetical protein